jgi:predicted RNase H-like HicB family nuclease
MHRYIALIHKDAGSAYGVMFPDFPGCVAAADTMDDALVQGREALAFHAEGMRLDGVAIPAPRTLDDIKAAREDWIDWEGAIVAAIPLVPPKGEAVRVNINLDKNLLAAADDAAKRAHQSRSAFVARALESALEG